MRMFAGLMTAAIIAVCAVHGWAAAAADVLHHDITAVLDPATHRIKVTDRWRLPAGAVSADTTFALHSGLKVRSLSKGITVEQVSAQVPGRDVGMDRDSGPGNAGVSVTLYRLKGVRSGAEVTVELAYEGEINHPVEQIGAEYARGFSQSPGLIEPRGVYLAGSSVWLPHIEGALITYRMVVDLPANWKSVSQGARIATGPAGSAQRDTWVVETPTEEAHLIAAPFTEYSRDVGAVKAQAFLRKPEPALAQRYLDATAQYMEMYRALIGPYPYPKFALVENFWETGYGMPSFTLLGEQVIRFPFILHSSYPHELLHNWWGNGVFVNFDAGNWCEGLTAYLADHLVSEQNGQGDRHRRDILLRVTDYVTPETDFPLTAFRSRYNPVTEAVGYGKTAMVFDMLRRQLGDAEFVQGLRAFYRDHRFRTASFADIRASFEAATGQDLKAFFAQWVDRPGIPELALVSAERRGRELTVTVAQTQSGAPFALDVPIAIHAGGQPVMETIRFRGDMARATQTFTLPAAAERVEVDPQFNVYRRLSPFEVPTSLSKGFGAEQALIVLPSTDEAARFAGLVKTWAKAGLEVVRDSDIKELPADRAVWLLGATNRLVPTIAGAVKADGAVVDRGGATLEGTRFAAADKSILVAARHPKTPQAAVVLITATSADAADALARKLPHYGKYSWLVFAGDTAENEAKGEWVPRNTPLARDLVAKPRLATLPQRPALATLPPPMDAARLKTDIDWLADPAREGRGVGTQGLADSAAYIAQRFKELALTPLPGGDFFQPFTMTGPSGAAVEVKNVIGLIPGADPALAGQSVVISAHYDHLGRGWPDVRAGEEGKIHPGADDNASGVAAILEIARLLKAQKPARTVVFAAFSGEEAGLLGARHYIERARAAGFAYPLGRVVANINLDTVGRLEQGRIRILGTDTAREWSTVFTESAAQTAVPLEVVGQDLGGSDQKAFVEAGVPGVQVFASTAVDYHRPTDTADKVDVDGVAKVTALVKEAVVRLAAAPQGLTFVAPQAAPAAAVAPAQNPRRVATGLVPDMAYQGKGVRAGSVADGSGAAQAGLRPGDVVIAMGGKPIDDLRGLSEALKTFVPAQEIEVQFIRDGKTQAVPMVLGAR